MGMTAQDCKKMIDQLLTKFPLVENGASSFGEWYQLVVTHSCLGKVAHDARYIAVMKIHGLCHLLTFNGSDFKRYPGLTIIEPMIVSNQKF